MSEKHSAWRNDAAAKVTGRARYTDDLKFHGLLHAVPVYTDHVHARIRAIDTAAAQRSPGVVRVITASDVPGSVTFGQILRDYHMLADDKVRFNGDVAAVLVAETRERAIAAIPLVKIEAEELPPLLDPDEAMKPGAPLVHEGHGSNVVNHHVVRRGDAAAALARCDHVIEQEFRTQFIEHAYLEPETAVAVPRQDGVTEIYASMQHPFSTRRFVAALLGVPLADVEVRTVPMGGGFGGKDDTVSVVAARAALAARLTGRPVKMTYDREWSVRESYKRHPYRIKYRLGFSREGRMEACEVRVVADAGAYCSVTPWVTWRSTVQCCGPYDVPHVHCDVYGVYTNNVVTGAMRGFGSPQMNFAIEQLVEMAAEKCGISATAFRRKNMLRQGSVTITGQTLDTHTVSLEQALDSTLGQVDFHDKYKKCSLGRSESDELYGIGYAISYRGMSLGAEGMDFNAAVINVQFDGSILLEAAVHENGQGAESAMVLLCAEELGVSRERIRYRMPSTANIPDGGTTVASRGTIMGGGAVVNAARALKTKLAELLAPQLSCKPDDVRFKDDHIWGKDDSHTLAFGEAMHQLFLMQEYPYSFGTFKAPKVSWDEHTGQGNAYFTWVYGCQAVELTVNKKTGRVKLLNMAASHEVGRAVNPAMVLGQFYGGMAMGTGYALFEQIQHEKGKIQNTNFDRYRIPRATDLPEMTGLIIENADPLSPSGAKGVGEPTNELMAPAIANAVYNATGRRHFALPIRIEPEDRP
ncbi:MAG: xanthine dehydrogenase family protein molybdopterin-binding subunit [Candidatus Edwardsbacteria bacterium]|jgi:CO/xanthine dehydrogenase Mo-binding subunit|nr:xanthine dehydrogenase family protein molybdopterin-binding subunit [Candidatus Edwardsbacteria bacterium]